MLSLPQTQRNPTPSNPMTVNNSITYPIMSQYSQASSAFMVPPELNSTQQIVQIQDETQLFHQQSLVQNLNVDYFRNRQPQRPSKRIRRFRCQYAGCDRCFDSQWSLERHIRIHTGERPYICQIANCGKRFTDKCALKRHEATHNDVKPYKCTYPSCSKAFKTKSYLEIHMRLHTEQDPYRCTIKGCNRSFSSPKSLHRHKSIAHNIDSNIPPTEHQLREKMIRLQNRSKEKIEKMEAQLKRALVINKVLKKQRSELRKAYKTKEKKESEEDKGGSQNTMANTLFMSQIQNGDRSGLDAQTNSQSSIAIPLIHSITANDTAMDFSGMDGTLLNGDGIETIAL